MQEQVDAGMMKLYTKRGNHNRIAADSLHRIDLISQEGRSGFQQKQGSPPAPEDAPPPRQIHDRNEKGKGEKGSGKGKGKASDYRGGKGKDWGRTTTPPWAPAARAALPTPASSSTRQTK